MKIGYWEPRTATIDWCEDNYQVNYYIAEFWNTVSNIPMMLFPICFLVASRKWNIGFQFKCLFLCLILVGIGSWAFHMTLRYPMQLLDELPMVWCSCFLLHTVLSMEKAVSVFKRGALITFATIFTATYLYFPNPLVHQITFGSLVGYTIYCTGSIVNLRKGSKIVGIISGLSYIIGFVFWNIDNVFCQNLRAFRSSRHAIINPLTQFHAWWHIFTGLGCYYYTIFLTDIFLSYRSQRRQQNIFGGFIVPIVEPVSLISKRC